MRTPAQVKPASWSFGVGYFIQCEGLGCLFAARLSKNQELRAKNVFRKGLPQWEVLSSLWQMRA